MSILFDSIIFGPVRSRRLGTSLGINLLPTKVKFCTFNCIYCECGWTHRSTFNHISLPKRNEIYPDLEKRLAELEKSGSLPEALTFAGNGEPTIHPEFPGILDDTIFLRQKYAPEAIVGVLSNATMLHKPEIVAALVKADKAILKLDAGTQEMFEKINDPASSNLNLETITQQMESFGGQLIIQTLFLKGFHNGMEIDNTSYHEVEAWINRLLRIKPKSVMIYTLDREPPEHNLEKISTEELDEIADKVRFSGISVEVY